MGKTRGRKTGPPPSKSNLGARNIPKKTVVSVNSDEETTLPDLTEDENPPGHRPTMNDLSKKSQSRRSALKLTEDQEVKAFEYVEAHPELYNKNHPNFCKRTLKDALWAELATTIQGNETDGTIASGPRMMTWFANMRSAYGKATRSPSGSGLKVLTQREEWLKGHLQFLDQHVYRVPKRCGVDLISQLKQRHAERFSDHVNSSDADSDETQVCEDPLPVITTETSKRKRRSAETASLMEKIEKRIEATQKQQEDLMQMEESEQMAFGRLVGISASEFDDEAWDAFQLNVQSLMIKYRRETRQRKSKTQVRSHTQSKAPGQQTKFHLPIHQAHQQPQPQPQSQPQSRPNSTPVTSYNSSDYQLAVDTAFSQHQQCPTGYMPTWQHVYQPPQPQPQPQHGQSERPSSAPPSETLQDFMDL